MDPYQSVLEKVSRGHPLRINFVVLEGKRVDAAPRPERVKEPAGTVKCLLHPERRTPEMEVMRLSTCTKANISDESQLQLHMQHRHKSSWKTIEEMKNAQKGGKG